MKKSMLKKVLSLALILLIAVLTVPVQPSNAMNSNDVKAEIVGDADTTAPVISDITVSNVSMVGYTVRCKVTDNVGVSKVAFPTWTLLNDQDDLASDFMNTQLGTKSGDTYTFRVNAADHKNETGKYVTHIYAVDTSGNTVSATTGIVDVQGTPNDVFLISSASSYNVEDKVIKNVKPSTSVNSVISNFENTTLSVKDTKGNAISGKTDVGTGYTLNLFNDGVLSDTLTIVVSGDVDGNAILDSTDCLVIKATFLEIHSLDKYQKMAADLDGNSTIEATDYMRMKKRLLSPAEEVVEASKPALKFDKTLQVTTQNGTANVTTKNGVSYTASGYSSYSNNLFKVNQGFTVNLGESFNESFNRLTLCYVSSDPMKCTVTYVVDGTTVNDLFYLEAGEQTFCALIKGYLEGKRATSISKITLSTCEGVSGTFALCNVKTEKYAVYTEDVHYIENDNYRLGIRMAWGGGICYLLDINGTDGLKNLINQADTGRLVQQSYYGANSSSDNYQMGYFNNSSWPYNPVQGGDKANNPSRIIDVVVGTYSVYIKAQPMDWGHDGKITPSYMENVYILDDEFVRVDNRFVDFSSMNHRYVHQELPAFYTVSYLDNFTYYAGTKPWTNDKLTSRNDLKFWGGEYHNDCEFRIKQSNTETWCAWTNTNSGYGIGLYVPKIDVFLAGRSGYNGTKDANASPTNYVAPLNQMLMVSYHPIEYSYLITTGSLTDIRATFKENKSFASNSSLRDYYKNYRIPD